MYIFWGMQVTKPAGRQWNTILNLVLSYLGFVKHVIDHALYTLKTTSTKDVLIYRLSIDDFLCDYYRIHLFKDFLEGINKSFPVTSKEGLQMSYTNLRIIQYPYDIGINQRDHIQDTIIAQQFPDNYEKVNSDSTTFKEYTTFEINLSETIPATPSEIHLLEER